MQSADFIKFNDEEIEEIAQAMNSPFSTLVENIAFIAKTTNTKAVCVTKGKHGASLFWNGKLYHNNGYPITVVDTVGAGDSFLATIITSLLTDVDPQESINLACAMGALVAASAGANPVISQERLKELIESK